MEAELKKILASSPWNKTEIENWRNILNAGQSGEFILKADADVIASYNRKCNKANYFIHTSLLPQPFIGNPEAPIWILNQNPGYCEIDHYEMLGEKTKIQEWMNKVYLYRCPVCGEVRCNATAPTCPGSYGIRSGCQPGDGYTCLGCGKGKYIKLPF